MEDKEMKEFSWTAFFLVTGFSLILFSKILQFLDGTRLQVFTWAGIVTIIIGSLYFILTLKEKPREN
jgi:predicted membrane channel-forming protein YqfA (hemolysin III family)